VRVYKASHAGPSLLPLVVLVDQETASAAEVVAGALHAHRRATLVGQPTFGKWSVQRVLELKSARSGIRVTLARFLSPGSEPYTIKGVVPDILEERSPVSMADNQLLVAIQVAVGMIEMRP
jgi:carboxyl-terminal processing protease